MNEIKDLLDHLLWTTKKVSELLLTMSDEQFSKKLDKDTRSVKDIIIHLISIYAYFSSPNEYKEILEKSKKQSKNDLFILLKDLTKKVCDIFENNPEKFIPVKTKGGKVKQISGFSLFHMVSDHFAYHRGQAMTIFKAITGNDGVGTDYAVFLMEDQPDIDL